MAKSLDRFNAEQSDIVQALEAQLDEKDRVLKEWKKEHGNLEVLFKGLLAAVSAADPIDIEYSSKAESNAPTLWAISQDTDWHIGEKQDADEIENINAFDWQIAQNRTSDLTHRSLRVIERSRLAYNIPKSINLCTGDMISGNLREESLRTNEFPEPVQVVRAAELYAARHSQMSKHFDHYTIEYVTADNHGRLTKKPMSKEQGINSFNYLVAIIAQKILSRHNNIEFNIHIEPQKVVRVFNRQYLLMHGHQIKGWAGVPWYGVERKRGKESESRLQLIMEDPTRIETLGFHKIITGHLHAPINMPTYAVGGSLSGCNAYDREAGRYANASQPLWFESEKHGDFGRIDFKL
jgi:hypothetical protein